MSNTLVTDTGASETARPESGGRPRTREGSSRRGDASTTDAEGVSPATIEDGSGRAIRFAPYEPAARESLVDMYATFDPTQRAQGIPPVRRDAVESWLDSVLEGPSLLAWHEDRVVGHVLFVPDGDGAHELAIFVHQGYQDAGVGTALLRRGLDHARAAGVTRVWLSVTWGNDRARAVYRRAGFERERTRSPGHGPARSRRRRAGAR